MDSEKIVAHYRIFLNLILVASNLKNGEQTDIIYIDLAKAFDRVDHLILAKKLCALFCPLNLFKTIINFITNRRYVLMIEGAKTN